MATATAPMISLSICISTFNRASYIGATLETILTQLPEDCELVVLDGASTDDTPTVVSAYAARFKCLRYIRQETNNGLDADYDRAVGFARGEYCWLMTDDDLLKPGAIAAVLQHIHEGFSLILVDVESMDPRNPNPHASGHRWLNFETDRIYKPSEMDRLFTEVGQALKYIGCFIVQRRLWLARAREQYYGSLFNYLGVIFQRPLPGRTLVIARPLVAYRWGNTHAWSLKLFEVRMIDFPSLVWAMAVPDSAKRRLCDPEPWRSWRELLMLRGRGLYSLIEYRKLIRPRLRSPYERLALSFIAVLPGTLVNTYFVLYFSLLRRRPSSGAQPEVILQLLRESRYYFRNKGGLTHDAVLTPSPNKP